MSDLELMTVPQAAKAMTQIDEIQRLEEEVTKLRSEVERLNSQIGEMALLMRGIIHRLGQDNSLSKRAIGYLARKGLQGSPLREVR